jgi:hypothetical protein
MGTIGLQTAIARLCLSRAYRTDFSADVDAAVRQVPLTSAAEAEAVRQLDVAALSEFGDTLISKRISMIRRWLPLSFRALDCQISPAAVNRHLDRFTQEHIRDGDDYAGAWKRRDSARVCEFLCGLVRRRVIPLPAAADVLAFETERFRLTIDPEIARWAASTEPAAAGALDARAVIARASYASVQRFRYNVPLLLGLIENQCAIDEVDEEPCTVLFVRCADGHVDTHAIGEGSQAILAECARPRRVADVVARVQAMYGTDAELEEAIRQEIARLVDARALVVTQVVPC